MVGAHLRFFLLYSPRWLFLYPGAFYLWVLGLCPGLPAVTALGVTFDAHTLLFSSLFMTLGYQSILFAVFAKTFAISEGFLPEDRRMKRFYQFVNLEKALIVGWARFCWEYCYWCWPSTSGEFCILDSLDYAHTMRFVIPGVTLTALGFQTILACFFISILGMRRR